MKQILNATKPVIGMLHVPALPGTPAHVLSIPEIISFVLREAEIYAQCDVDALLIENMHDVPYLKNQVGEEITAALTVVCLAVKQRYDLPCGVQILAAANRAALAVALAAGLQFIRAEGFVYAHIADEGYIESCAGDLLRYRKQIAASHIRIFTDIKKKHSAHTITADTSLAETIRTADFFRSDAIIIT
ncbi:MAG: BtpA family membrane complex biogenesis protein, partial [Candidatus Cloacimonetes bacterium]|nr:BtpA family membrane complex biogenesis protein [Candidatus Cloacimonadota bacterium]